jgi:hypothetical protein
MIGQAHFPIGSCSAKVVLVLSTTALGRKVHRYRSLDVLTLKATPAIFPVMLQ